RCEQPLACWATRAWRCGGARPRSSRPCGRLARCRRGQRPASSRPAAASPRCWPPPPQRWGAAASARRSRSSGCSRRRLDQARWGIWWTRTTRR
ncbi:unnamed protein product, partial [Prorocentrum cordatum]